MNDDFVSLFTFNRWANARCSAEPVRSTKPQPLRGQDGLRRHDPRVVLEVQQSGPGRFWIVAGASRCAKRKIALAASPTLDPPLSSTGARALWLVEFHEK
jgi:hypothetical protein